MSYEGRLWSRQEVSLPYIVVCLSASRILMLSWRGCRAASLCKKHDLGPVALWENRNGCKKGSECPLAVEPASASELGICHERCRERGGNCLILPSLTQETVPPSQIYFTLSLPPLPPPLSQPSLSHTFFSLPLSVSPLILLLFFISSLDASI